MCAFAAARRVTGPRTVQTSTDDERHQRGSLGQGLSRQVLTTRGRPLSNSLIYSKTALLGQILSFDCAECVCV